MTQSPTLQKGWAFMGLHQPWVVRDHHDSVDRQPISDTRWRLHAITSEPDQAKRSKRKAQRKARQITRRNSR